MKQKYHLCKQFVAWSCNGSSVALLTDYMNQLINQVSISEDDYFDVLSDERIYLDLTASSGYVKEAEKLERNDSKVTLHILLKEAATKKLRLRIWACALEKYLYILTKNGPNLKTEYMQSIKLAKICWNERETICKKRCVVHWW